LGQTLDVLDDSSSAPGYPTAGPAKNNNVMGRTITTRMTAALVAVAAGAVGLRLVRRVEVRGASMRPTLEPGDRLLVLAWRRIRAGDLVALPDPRLPTRTLVKRVGRVHDASLTVLGDDPAVSTDSRSFGPVPRGTVLGRAVYRYAPSRRAGPIKRGSRAPPR
jgi:nickel-type superoxide dismutase maturation protease